MHANELLKHIVNRIVHHTESERDLLLAAVDIAFPLDEPKPELPSGGLDMETRAKLGILPGGDEGQAPGASDPLAAPSPEGALFSDTPSGA